MTVPNPETSSYWLLIFTWSTGALVIAVLVYSIIKHFLTSRRTSHGHRRENGDEARHLTDNNQEMVPEAVRGQNTFVIKIDGSSDLPHELEKGVVCPNIAGQIRIK